MRPSKIIISGGGIGGLSAAIALLQRGIDVDVLEQAGELREVGAGIQISPNGNRTLESLGVLKQLQKLSCNSDEKEIRHWQTGRTWKLFSDSNAVVDRYGYPYMTVFRPDLLSCLANKVRELKPDAIKLNSRCISFEENANGVRAHLQDGSEVLADGLVGADGIHSLIRPALFGVDDLEYLGMTVWRSLIPMKELPEHLRRNVAVNWCSPAGHLVHYPVKGGEVMNFVATRLNQPWDGPPWNRPSSIEECSQAFAGWHPDIQTLISHCGPVLKWALCIRPFLDRWSSNRVTLLGDACHATPPFLAQGAVCALEDGVILARCLDEVSGGIAPALKRYEALRMPHSYRMVRGALANGDIIHSPRLADPEEAERFGEEVWSNNSISERYDWLYSYDVNTVEI